MKKIFKTILLAFCIILTFPFWLVYRITQNKHVFSTFAEVLSLAPGIFGSYLRVAYYKMTLKKCSRDVYIGMGTIFSRPNAQIGKGVYIGSYCIIGLVEISDGCIIASGVHIPSGRHQHSYHTGPLSIQKQESNFQQISIGNNSWIGEGAVVMANLGARNIVGAGSVVVNDTGEDEVVVGNPARPINREKQV